MLQANYLRSKTTMRREWADKARLEKYKHNLITRCGAAGSARALGARCRRFESCHLDHKETIILIREISVLWLFYCKNRGNSPFVGGFIAKMQACWDGFRPCKHFLFLAAKCKSFTLYLFRSIYGVSFNLSLWIIFLFYTYKVFTQNS